MDDKELERSALIMEDFLGYVSHSKFYNFKYDRETMTLKDILRDLKKRSKDISDVFAETGILYSYIDAVANLDDESPDYELGIRTLDYWWVANLLKNRHNDLKSYSYIKSECLSNYALLTDQKVKSHVQEYLSDMLPKEQHS